MYPAFREKLKDKFTMPPKFCTRGTRVELLPRGAELREASGSRRAALCVLPEAPFATAGPLNWPASRIRGHSGHESPCFNAKRFDRRCKISRGGALSNMQRVRPGMPVLQASSKMERA